MKININIGKIIKYLVISYIGYYVIMALFTIITGYSIKFGEDDAFCRSFFKTYKIELFPITVSVKRASDFIAGCNSDNYVFRIQEIKDLNHIKLPSIKFYYNADLDHIKLHPAQNTDFDKDYSPTIMSYWNQSYDSGLRVRFGKETKIDTMIRDKKRIIIYAHIDKMLFSDGNNNKRMLYDYKNIKKSILLFFKVPKEFIQPEKLYIITMTRMPNASKEISLDALNIFKDKFIKE